MWPHLQEREAEKCHFLLGSCTPCAQPSRNLGAGGSEASSTPGRRKGRLWVTGPGFPPPFESVHPRSPVQYFPCRLSCSSIMMENSPKWRHLLQPAPSSGRRADADSAAGCPLVWQQTQKWSGHLPALPPCTPTRQGARSLSGMLTFGKGKKGRPRQSWAHSRHEILWDVSRTDPPVDSSTGTVLLLENNSFVHSGARLPGHRPPWPQRNRNWSRWLPVTSSEIMLYPFFDLCKWSLLSGWVVYHIPFLVSVIHFD